MARRRRRRRVHITGHVEDVAKIYNKFDLLPRQVQRVVADRAAENLAAYVFKFARVIAPRESGRLRANIRVAAEARGETYVRLVVQIEAVKFPGTFYPPYVELGTEHQLGQDYMKRSADAGAQAAPHIWAMTTERHWPELAEYTV